MADALFEEQRLAAVYDPLHPDRGDLDAYVAIAQELGVHSVLDIGCGTGTFACRLAELGFGVTGLDPAAASLGVAPQNRSQNMCDGSPGTSSHSPHCKLTW